MNRGSFLALLVPTLASSALASGTPSNPFDELDRDAESLASSLQTPTGPQVGTLLRTSYDMSSDDVFSVGGEDLGGFHFQDAQVWFSGAIADWDMFLKLDAAESFGFPPIDPTSGIGAVGVRDAWARTHFAENFQFYFGQFKCPFVASGNVNDDSLLFIDRTRVGQLFSMPGAYQPGAAVTGDFGQFHVKAALQNGADGAADEYGMVLRGEMNLAEGAKDHEGALGHEGIDATIGIGYFADGSQIGGADFGSALAIDAYATMNQFSGHAEIVDFDDDLAANALGNANDDATAFSLTVGYLINEQFEAAVRYQDLDNELEQTVLSGGVNYYLAGHNAKWQFNLSQYEDDNDDGLLVQIGLCVGASQP